MSMDEYTEHARVRSHQRGIPELMVVLWRHYGDREQFCGGCCKLSLSDDQQTRMRRELSDLLARADHLQDAFLVENADGKIVTVGHQPSRQLRRRMGGATPIARSRRVSRAQLVRTARDAYA